MQKSVVLNFGHMRQWWKRYLLVEPSVFKPGRFDHLGNSQLVLKHFSAVNKDKVKGIKTSKEYSWSRRQAIHSGNHTFVCQNKAILTAFSTERRLPRVLP